MDGNAAASSSPAGPSSSLTPPQQLSPPIALSKRTSSKHALRETFRDAAAAAASPPTTPPPRRRTRKREKGKQPLRAHASLEEEVSARNSSGGGVGGGGVDGGYNPRHSHGLSWSSTTRDSVVDNLLFALDTFSRQDIPEGEEDFRDAEFDRQKYTFPNAAPVPMSRTAQRARGHTYSSSLSSDYDRHGVSDSPSTYTASTKGRRSNSSSNIPTHHTISSRMRPTSKTIGARTSSDTQKGAVNAVQTNGGGKARKESADVKSAADYSYGDLIGPGRIGLGRRSMSMDQIYEPNGHSILDRGRPVPSVHSRYEPTNDAAPEPMIAAGPRRMQNPTATGPVYVNQASSRTNTLRKTTTQSDLRIASNPSPPVPSNVRNQASEFVHASSIRGVPSIPPVQDYSAPAPSPGLHPPSLKNPSSQRERPGFFKRVFGGGSSRSASGTSDRAGSLEYGDLATVPARTSSSNSSHPPRTGTRQGSKDQPTGTSYPPVSLNKKPSSFFRRRKKSTSDMTQPPPLPLNNSLSLKPAEPSPSVSSLRKVMDPYLSTNRVPRQGKAVDGSRPTTTESSTENSDSLDIFHSGYTPPTGASLGNRDPLSRTPSVKPKHSVETQASARMRMKVKKRKPEILVSPTETDFPRDNNNNNNNMQPTPLEPPKMSPLSEIQPDEKENQRPASRASTGDRILASKGTSPVDEEPNFTAFPIVNAAADDDWLVTASNRPSTTQDRPESKKSDRLFLQPTTSEERLHYSHEELSPVIESSYTASMVPSARSPPLPTAATATFASALHSPITPSTLYHSASSLPLPSLQVDGNEPRKSVEANGMKLSSELVDEGAEYRERARKIFEGDEEDVTKAEAASWLGEKNTLSTRTLEAYMELFDFAGYNILAALRALCGKLVLKGETQQFDRIITALSSRWCESNANHGFKAQDVVHTIFYSLILLNTDLHLADIAERMSRSAYVKNTLPSIRRVVADAAPNAFDETVKPSPNASRPTLPWSNSSDAVLTPISPGLPSPIERTSFEQSRPNFTKRLSMRPTFDRKDSDGWTPDSAGGNASNALVGQPWAGSMRGWELEVESILKSFFASIRSDPLPLLGAPVVEYPSAERNLSVANFGGLKRSGSVVSKAPSDATSYRSKPGFRTMTMGFQSKYNRSRPKLYPASTLASSRTSFDDGSVWSPVQSSNWSKYSFSKTLTSASMQSLGQHFSPTVGDFKHSIGFANALSQAIIREENASGAAADSESVSMSVPGGLLEDETLALEGAPWAKEGLVKHKHHLETPGKKAKERSWNDCFAVLSKGKLTLFAFNTSTKSQSLGRKTLAKQQQSGTGRAATAASLRVGGGDWMENAEQLDVFVLRQTIASTLPPPGYSKTRPHVWALSLPSGAVHLFQVGTPEIAQEFMSTANYWSARLSKEPLQGSVSNIEYGWSDQVINPALVEQQSSEIHPSNAPPSSLQKSRPAHMHSNSGGNLGRPSFQSSVRGSIDAGFGSRARLPGDKVQLAEWHPPTQSMMASQLMEVDQLKALAAYVGSVETELARHNELKHAIELAYTPRHANYIRALANWQRKSEYLLREIVKFQTYVDGLAAAAKVKEKFYARKSRQSHEDAAAIAPAPATVDGGDELGNVESEMKKAEVDI